MVKLKVLNICDPLFLNFGFMSYHSQTWIHIILGGIKFSEFTLSEIANKNFLPKVGYQLWKLLVSRLLVYGCALVQGFSKSQILDVMSICPLKYARYAYKKWSSYGIGGINALTRNSSPLTIAPGWVLQWLSKILNPVEIWVALLHKYKRVGF